MTVLSALRRVFIVALVVCLSQTAAAQDEIDKAIDLAEQQFADLVQDEHEKLLKELERIEKQAVRRGELDLVQACRKETKALENDGVLPTLVDAGGHQRRIDRAAIKLKSAFEKAIVELTKLGETDRALLLQSQLAAIAESTARRQDLLKSGVTWNAMPNMNCAVNRGRDGSIAMAGLGQKGTGALYIDLGAELRDYRLSYQAEVRGAKSGMIIRGSRIGDEVEGLFISNLPLDGHPPYSIFYFKPGEGYRILQAAEPTYPSPGVIRLHVKDNKLEVSAGTSVVAKLDISGYNQGNFISLRCQRDDKIVFKSIVITPLKSK